jgi:hypothetical protein
MNVNVWDVNDPIRRLMSERVTVEDRHLADPEIPIDQPRGPPRWLARCVIAAAG